MVKESLKRLREKIVVVFITFFLTIFFTVTPSLSFNIGEEREVGEKLLYAVRSSFKLIDDPDITQYITRLGQSVLEVAGVQYFDYHFFVIDNREFNAFAAPSGLIFFHSGLISTIQSEDELVSVLAHEIGHIVKRHLASRVEKGTYTSIASLGLAMAAVAFGGAAAPVLLTGALATGQSVNLHFSRQHEEEADLLAYEWMKSLDRDPDGQARMLESMRRIARYRSEKLPQYLLTHPNPEARMHTIMSLIDAETKGKAASPSVADEFDFLRFKYRVLSQVKEGNTLRGFLASVASGDRSTDIGKTMAKYGLALIADNENDYEKALTLLAEVIEKFPKKTILKVDRGAIELSAGKNSQAEATLKAALSEDNTDMYGTYLLAKLLSRTGRLEDARQLFTTVSYELPEYSKVYFQLGQIASAQKRAGEANFFLGKYNLYEGKISLARSSLKAASRDKRLPEEMKKQAKELLEKIKKLKK